VCFNTVTPHKVKEEKEMAVSPKSRLAVTLLAWFLGMFGAHRFYLGKTGTAVTMLVLGIVGLATSWLVVGFFFLGAVWIWAIIDFVYAVAGLMKDKEGKLITKW
jgi:TM2 domain-containing membrane protein YozV